MKMFMLKAIFLASIMFVSVLFGMQQANEGIQRMKGYSDDDFKAALTLSESEEGELQASVLGNDVSSHDLQQKKEKLEEIKAYNFFSSLGKSISEGLSSLTEKSIAFITELLTGK
ncbi:YqxA family protein [Bacillus sp. ISL-47]|uniref:YqxA family protein n=1 Tax=Bacillus sp. ISL-47 TaxID=2819130 RepID=UPI001BE54987|nr:YqxA family protein [Bacillus sp. ISL-47]MBT2690285.1 YqxA family protein [Bacillus sp. ISL-47]MBT2708010.1 YqxA family protein [Pseudomonas sp. ISL-84]